MPHNGPYCQANTAMHTLMDRVDRIAPTIRKNCKFLSTAWFIDIPFVRAADPGPAVGEPAPAPR